MTDTLRTRHKISGAIDENTPRHVFEHPVIGAVLEEVGPEAKPYLPAMHRVTLPEDYSDAEVAAAQNAGLDVDALQAEAKARAEAEADPKPSPKKGEK